MSMALAASGFAALAAAVLARPQIATLLVVCVVWLNVPGLAVSSHGVPASAAALFPLPLLIPLAYQQMRGRRLVVNGTFAALLAFAVAMSVSTIFATHQDVATEKLRELALEGVLVYALVLNVVRDPGTLRAVLWALVIAGCCLALVSIHQKLTASFYRPYGGLGQVDSAFFRGQADVPRLAGPLGDPNYYAQILLPVVAIALLAAWRERRRILRVAGGAAAALACVAITFTYSRGAALGLAAIVTGLAVLRYLRPPHLVAVALALALIVAVNPGYRDRVGTLAALGGLTATAGETVEADESSRSRTTEMAAAGLAFLDHPLLGVGPGGFPFAYQDYAPLVGIEVRETTDSGAQKGEAAKRESHNIVVGLAADTGLLGLGTFSAVVLLTLRDLRRARRRWLGVRADFVNLADSLSLALVAYLVSGLFLTLAFERYFWLLLALAGAAGAGALGPMAAAETNAAKRSS
jgi:putative inorganic carbon (hco3(-)) transporter